MNRAIRITVHVADESWDLDRYDIDPDSTPPDARFLADRLRLIADRIDTWKAFRAITDRLEDTP